jgi:four helix bundle protein
MARGSLSETLDHLIIAYDEQLITAEKYDSLKFEYNKCLKLLNGYIVHLRNKKAEVNI